MAMSGYGQQVYSNMMLAVPEHLHCRWTEKETRNWGEDSRLEEQEVNVRASRERRP
jgi:hypothetical protein